METKDIRDLPLAELKALAYDLLRERAIIEQNISTVQAEIKLKEAPKADGNA